jgi:hypothetical protein
LWFGGQTFENGTHEEFDEDCQFPCQDLSDDSPRSPHDELFAYNFHDIDALSAPLGIPWEPTKDTPFADKVVYIGFEWDLDHLVVSLTPKKQAKYLAALKDWQRRPTHTLNDLQKLHGKLVHTCSVLPQGRPYLIALEAMFPLFHNSPFATLHPPKDVAPDLLWWSDALSAAPPSCTVPRSVTITTIKAFSDASSSHGLGILLQGKWRAWTLCPGWTSLNGKRDIGWAEAVAMELLVYHVSHAAIFPQNVRIFCDNQGVVDAWRSSKSRNKPVNSVFKRLLSFLQDPPVPLSIFIEYIPSEENPADPISRGLLPPIAELLPSLPLPTSLTPFLTDLTHT